MQKKMSLAVAVVIVVAVVGVLAYLSINKNSKTMENNSILVSKVGDTLSMNYTGSLADGTVFDSNIDPKFNHVQPFVFTLGARQVISGWDEGLVGMKVGEKKHLVLRPDKAYGPQGHPPVIPPNATLTFDVELLAIN